MEIRDWLLEKIYRVTRSIYIRACRYKLVKRVLGRDIARSELQHVTLCYIEFNSSSNSSSCFDNRHRP